MWHLHQVSQIFGSKLTWNGKPTRWSDLTRCGLGTGQASCRLSRQASVNLKQTEALFSRTHPFLCGPQTSALRPLGWLGKNYISLEFSPEWYQLSFEEKQQLWANCVARVCRPQVKGCSRHPLFCDTSLFSIVLLNFTCPNPVDIWVYDLDGLFLVVTDKPPQPKVVLPLYFLNSISINFQTPSLDFQICPVASYSSVGVGASFRRRMPPTGGGSRLSLTRLCPWLAFGSQWLMGGAMERRDRPLVSRHGSTPGLGSLEDRPSASPSSLCRVEKAAPSDSLGHAAQHLAETQPSRLGRIWPQIRRMLT